MTMMTMTMVMLMMMTMMIAMNDVDVHVDVHVFEDVGVHKRNGQVADIDSERYEIEKTIKMACLQTC